MIPDVPPLCVGSMALIQIHQDPPRIHHGSRSPGEGNGTWAYETDPMKNEVDPEILKQIPKLPVLYWPTDPPKNCFLMERLPKPYSPKG